ncbi:MAG: AAA family ATPase, partial [Atopobiaceae bacterium]|nr:AAA family ATPase [Atopobiaceae bacterium]
MRSRSLEIESRKASAERDRSDAGSELERIGIEIADATGRISRLEQQIAELEPKADAARSERDEVERIYARMSSDLRDALRTADSETLQYARLRDEVSNAEIEDSMFRNRSWQLEEGMGITRGALDQWSKRKEDIDTRLEAALSRVSALTAVCDEQERAQESLRDELDKAREELSRARASLSAMKAVDEAADAASPLVATLAHDEDGSKLVECRLGDLVEAPSELEGVVERILGTDLSALVVADIERAGELSETALGMVSLGGTATIVPLSGLASTRSSDADMLLDRLTIDPRAESLFGALLGDVHVSDTLASALSRRAGGSLGTYVCLDGSMILADGRIQVGTEVTQASGSLERKRRIRSLERGMSSLESDLESKTSALSEARESFERANSELQTMRGDAARLEGESQGAASELARLNDQLIRSQAELQDVERRRVEATKRLEEVRPGLEEHRQAAEAANKRASDLTHDMDDLGTRRTLANEAEGKAQTELSEARLSLATAKERMRYLESRSPFLSDRISSSASTISELECESRRISLMIDRVDPLKTILSELRSCASEVSARLAERADLEQADSDTLRSTIDEARGRLARASRALESAQEETNSIKVELGRLEVQVEAAIQAIVDGGSMPLEEALELPEPEDRAADEREIERLNRSLAQIGPVNEVALDQYNEMKERADYIDSQVGDLESASRSLARISQAIDRKMRDAFITTFDSVNANFEDIFSVLFPGGHAHLELTDPENPTESGVEIIAQPRGKKLSKISLLSGGEKALTSLALLFAVYRTRTVPFYVFDEVEAALDDSNLDRLLNAINTLKETTQLIVISHQRRTMEMADVLWGVSMHADGVSHVVSQRLDHSTGKVVDA